MRVMKSIQGFRQQAGNLEPPFNPYGQLRQCFEFDQQPRNFQLHGTLAHAIDHLFVLLPDLSPILLVDRDRREGEVDFGYDLSSTDCETPAARQWTRRSSIKEIIENRNREIRRQACGVNASTARLDRVFGFFGS
jgi:hypothetical protein